jgi:hypothetical protein
MFAAHALRQLNINFHIYSKHRRSEMFGAQYLHKPIDGLSEQPPVQVKYLLEGDADSYKEKVYAQELSRVESTSPQDLQGEHPAWDIREAYYKAYRRYSGQILQAPNLQPSDVRMILAGGLYEAVISTVPAPVICEKGHNFNSVEILAAGDAPERGVVVPGCFDCPPDTVICNGDPAELWYRQSNVFGQRTVEWPIEASWKRHLDRPNHRIVEGVEAAIVKKPIDKDCDCFAGEPLIRMGRYGKWQKGELAHQAYFDTIKLFASA